MGPEKLIISLARDPTFILSGHKSHIDSSQIPFPDKLHKDPARQPSQSGIISSGIFPCMFRRHTQYLKVSDKLAESSDESYEMI